ncbi:hypothetical protein ONS95_003729, partial [Cadophora gregata]|uniref:uncharacterized protein n=1 Tax=Cadophora gregata TaxID=51156 RepID=UPI0026DCB8E4
EQQLTLILSIARKSDQRDDVLLLKIANWIKQAEYISRLRTSLKVSRMRLNTGQNAKS